VTASGDALTTPTPTAPKNRSKYIDTLRALAITRVFLHHTLWISWLAVLFPSMYVMFGLAGTLTAATLERKGPATTVRSRLRRLLPPLWAMAAVAVPLMLIHGWDSDPANPLRWSDLFYWVLPIANPPASSWGGSMALALWYLRAYLWFVLLSPMLWWSFKRWPIPTLLAPLTTLIILHLPFVPMPVNKVSDVLWSTATYGTCWVMGFARHTRLLDRVPFWICIGTAAVLGVGSYLWGARHGGFPYADPIAEAVWGTGFVLVALRARPSLAWLERIPWLAKLVGAVNARAITIYIWQEPLLFLTGAMLQRAGLVPLTIEMKVASLLIGLPLTVLATLLIGWVEDVAARRKPALVPEVSAPAPPPQPAKPAPVPTAA
jgi:peptidoglycan/LPS O-acetylase OafA/YrhL